MTNKQENKGCGKWVEKWKRHCKEVINKRFGETNEIDKKSLK